MIYLTRGETLEPLIRFDTIDLSLSFSDLTLVYTHTHTHTHTNAQLCIFLNNVNHIHNRLSQCSRDLDLDPFFDWLEEKQKLGQKCKYLVEKICHEAEEEMGGIIRVIMFNIAKKVYTCI